MKRVWMVAAVTALSLGAAWAEGADAPKAVTSWKPGDGLDFKLSNFELKLGLRLQGRFTYDDQDYCGDCASTLDQITTTDVATGVTTTTNATPVKTVLGDPVTGQAVKSINFAIRRIKMITQGWAFDPRFKYDVQLESVSGNKSINIGLKEANVDLQFKPSIQLKIGQWKGPYGRQRITSDGKGQFVDLSVATDNFAMGFEDGVMLHGTAGGEKNDKMEWNAGVFNGAGQNPSLQGEIDPKPLWAARIVYMPFGQYSYAESSLDSPDRFEFFVGGSWNTNTQTAIVSGATTGSKSVVTTGKTGFEIGGETRRINFAGEYFWVRTTNNTASFNPAATATTPPVLASQSTEKSSPRGYYAQFGVFALPQVLEFALRASEYDPNRDLANQKTQEYRLAINWYISRDHAHKLQTDVGRITRQFNGSVVEGNPGNPASDDREVFDKQLRVQYQFWF